MMTLPWLCPQRKVKTRLPHSEPAIPGGRPCGVVSSAEPQGYRISIWALRMAWSSWKDPYTLAGHMMVPWSNEFCLI